MESSLSSRSPTSSEHPSTSYMPLQKKAPTSPHEVKLKKPRRWGCCRISIALISLVFFVAFVVTVVYVVLFTDLVRHVTGNDASSATPGSSLLSGSRSGHSGTSSGHSGGGRTGHNATNELPNVNTSKSEQPASTQTTAASPLKELNILVLVVDTRSHIMDNGSFKATIDLWRKTESAWRELYDNKAMTDRLTVMFCQSCQPVGVKDEDNTPTVFYTVEHFRGDTHSFNPVLFVALPTPPGEILTVLKRHGRTNALGEICQKGTWSSTGCDFKVAKGRQPDGKKAVYNFGVEAPSMVEQELLKYGKMVVMQKTIDTFKVLINQPMAVR